MSTDILLASSDAGNGGTNTITETGKQYYTASVRATVTGATMGLKDMEQEFDYADWKGQRYTVGDNVVHVSKRGLSRHTGANRYGNDFHQFMVAYSLAKLGVKSSAIDLMLYCPPGLYKQSAPYIKSQFTAAPAEIQLKSDKKPRVYEYANVGVLPEGVAAMGAFLFDDSGQVQTTDLFAGNVAIIDLGAETADIAVVKDGKLNVEMLEFSTAMQSGVDAHIRTPILLHLFSYGEDFKTLTADDIDLVIRRGENMGDYDLRVAGKVVNLKAIIEAKVFDYAVWVADNIIDQKLNSLNGYKAAILVGGGSLLIEARLREWHKDKILDRRQYPHAAKVSPLWLNAVGGLRFRKNKMLQMAK